MNKYRIVKHGKRFRVQFFVDHEWYNAERGLAVFDTLEDGKNYIQELLDQKHLKVLFEVSDEQETAL